MEGDNNAMNEQEEEMGAEVLDLKVEEAGEARKPKPYNNPRNPTRQEVADHELTHLPYRVWCRFCVEGRSHKAAHRIKTEEGKEQSGVPRVSMDEEAT